MVGRLRSACRNISPIYLRQSPDKSVEKSTPETVEKWIRTPELTSQGLMVSAIHRFSFQARVLTICGGFHELKLNIKMSFNAYRI